MIEPFVSYLNANQGFVMAALTFVYVVATIVIVYFNKKTIDEMKEEREAESRPYLFAHLAFIPGETKRCQLVLKNYGKSGAYIKSFSISPEIQLVKGPNDCAFFSKTIIAPNQSIQLLVLDPMEQMHEISYTVQLTYGDTLGNKWYSETYSLIQQYAGEAGSVTTNRGKMEKYQSAIIDISHSLDVIKNSMV